MLRVVHNGCEPPPAFDLNRSAVRARLGLAEQDPLALTVAHLNSCKGHDHLLDAMLRVAREFPRARLLLAGSGPEEDRLRSHAAQIGVDNLVQFLGFRDDVAELLHTADLFVLPSLAEGLSAVLLEAASVGCPVVSTAVGGAKDLFATSRGQKQPLAWLVPPADVDALAESMMEALRDDRERKARAARARERVRSAFSVDALVANTLAVYREVIVQKRVA
jgi:glycosyltransferase involved in cell wall biosynthesis